MISITMQALSRPVALGTPPGDSRVSGLYATTHLADAYEIRLPDDAITDPEALARYVFTNLAPWVIGLMRVRDAVMARFHLKTSRQLRASGDRRIAIFRIYERGANEIILGEDDRHLDFRISLMRATRRSGADEHPYLTLSTIVHCHNRFGRMYLLVIGPFHRLIVKAALRRAARCGWPRRAIPT